MKNLLKLFMCLALLVGFINCSESKNMDNLTQKQKDIAAISALTAIGNQEKLEAAISKGLDNGMTLNELKEVLVQMYAYCGFPRSLNAINTAMKVTDAREAKGIEDKAGEEPKTVNIQDKYSCGTKNKEVLFGKANGKAPFEIFAPASDTFLKEHLFCDIFERGVLTYKDRECKLTSILRKNDREI